MKAPAKPLPPPTKAETKRLREAVRLYNADLISGMSAADAAIKWQDRGLWNGVDYASKQ